MSKHRVGLQKEFSAIFNGVWIPQKSRAKQPSDVLTQKEQQKKRQIEEIIRTMKCSKDFECYKSGFKNLCKAKITGDDKLVECSPENQRACEFRISFVDRAFCKCQLRCYIAKNFHK